MPGIVLGSFGSINALEGFQDEFQQFLIQREMQPLFRGDSIELARRGHVTQPRMSQIMALNQLAPDIQEALLNLPSTKGKPEIHEKRLRSIAAVLC